MQLDGVCKKEYNQGNSFKKRGGGGVGRKELEEKRAPSHVGIRTHPFVSNLNNSTTELKVFHPLIIAFGDEAKI